MENLFSQQSGNKKIRNTVLIVILLGLVGGLILITQRQIFRERAVGPSCPINGATCEWDEIPGVNDYEVRIEKQIGETLQSVIFSRASKTKLLFTPEVGAKYICTVRPIINTPGCEAMPEESAETTCSAIELSPTPTPTPTITPTLPPGVTPSETPTPTITPTPTPSETPSPTPSPTQTPTPTLTVTPTPTRTPTPTPTQTPTPTVTPTPTPTSTPTPTPTSLPTSTPTPTITPTLPPGVTPTITPTPTPPIIVQITQVIAPTAAPGQQPAPTRVIVVYITATPQPEKIIVTQVSPTTGVSRTPTPAQPVSGILQIGALLIPVILIIAGLLL